MVELSLAVAERLGLDSRRRRNVEFAALLHDVGKIAVPKEIINKPGPLDEEEWAIMRKHTIEGEAMPTGRRPVEAALAELRACAGTQFDPRVAEELAEIAQA